MNTENDGVVYVKKGEEIHYEFSVNKEALISGIEKYIAELYGENLYGKENVSDSEAEAVLFSEIDMEFDIVIDLPDGITVDESKITLESGGIFMNASPVRSGNEIIISCSVDADADMFSDYLAFRNALKAATIKLCIPSVTVNNDSGYMTLKGAIIDGHLSFMAGYGARMERFDVKFASAQDAYKQDYKLGLTDSQVDDRTPIQATIKVKDMVPTDILVSAESTDHKMYTENDNVVYVNKDEEIGYELRISKAFISNELERFEDEIKNTLGLTSLDGERGNITVDETSSGDLTITITVPDGIEVDEAKITLDSGGLYEIVSKTRSGNVITVGCSLTTQAKTNYDELRKAVEASSEFVLSIPRVIVNASSGYKTLTGSANGSLGISGVYSGEKYSIDANYESVQETGGQDYILGLTDSQINDKTPIQATIEVLEDKADPIEEPRDSIRIRKKWEGDEPANRPKSITVQLYFPRDWYYNAGDPYGDPIELTENNWSAWDYVNRLVYPLDRGEGFAIAEVRDFIFELGVREVDVPDGYVQSAERTIISEKVDSKGVKHYVLEWTITNTYTQFVVNKVDENGNHLSGAEFTMYDENGVPIDVQTTNSNGVAKFSGFGAGKYTVRETKAPAGFLASTETISFVNDGDWDNNAASAQVTVVNTPIVTPTYTSLTVTKQWTGDFNPNQPKSITIQLYRNFGPYGEPVVISAADDWTFTWNNLDISYAWSVDETSVPDGYTKSISSSGTSWTITNNYTTPIVTPTYTSLTVTKQWTGDANPNQPTSVSVQLYRDNAAFGEPVIISAADGWTHTWNNLDDSYTWSVDETSVPDGYTKSVSSSGTSWKIKNTFVAPMTDENAPQTGDGTNMLFWLALMLGSPLGMLGIGFYEKKHDRKAAYRE